MLSETVRVTYTILSVNGISNTVIKMIIGTPICNKKSITFSTAFRMINFFDVYGIVKVYIDIHNHMIYNEYRIHIDNGGKMKRLDD